MMSQTMEQTDTSSLQNNEDPDKKQKSRRPANTAFRQQRLKAWQPILTPKTVLPLFFAVGVIFAPIGGLLLYASSQVQEILIDYTKCGFDSSQGGPMLCNEAKDNLTTMPSDRVTSHFNNATDSADAPSWCRSVIDVPYSETNTSYTVPTNSCTIQFTIPNDIGSPVLLYYQLTNFYQNHRRYVKSFDQDQLAGQARSNDSIDGSQCDPLQLDTDPRTGAQKAIYPCGLIANSLFNDTFSSPVLLNAAGSSNGSVEYPMSNDNIAWASDAELYKETEYTVYDVVPPPNWKLRYPDGYNDDFPLPALHEMDAFQVWMRTAGLPTFSKLALRNSNQTMTAGRYQIVINDNFPAYKYDGTKSILLSTRTVMGGRNPFLGIAYIVVGGICVVLGTMFLATHLIKPRKLGDHSYLSWTTDQSAMSTASGRAARPGEHA